MKDKQYYCNNYCKETEENNERGKGGNLNKTQVLKDQQWKTVYYVAEVKYNEDGNNVVKKNYIELIQGWQISSKENPLMRNWKL